MGQTGQGNKITAIARPNGYISRILQDYLKKEFKKPDWEVSINRF